MNPNGVKVTGERLTQNSRPGFFLGYGEALTRALARVDRLPLYDIYESKSQNNLQNHHSSPSHPLDCLHFQQFHGQCGCFHVKERCGAGIA